jgi:hypothetical protein
MQQLAKEQQACHGTTWHLSSLQSAAAAPATTAGSGARAAQAAMAVHQQGRHALLDAVCLDTLDEQRQQPAPAGLAPAVPGGPERCLQGAMEHCTPPPEALQLLQQLPSADDRAGPSSASAHAAAAQCSYTRDVAQLSTSWLCCYMRMALLLMRKRVFFDKTFVHQAKAEARQHAARAKKQRSSQQQQLHPAGADDEARQLQELAPVGADE